MNSPFTKAHFRAQICYPYYLAHQIGFGFDLDRVDFDPLQTFQHLILDDSIHSLRISFLISSIPFLIFFKKHSPYLLYAAD